MPNLPPHPPKTDREKAEALSLCYQWIDEKRQAKQGGPHLGLDYDHPSWARWRSAARILNLPGRTAPSASWSRRWRKHQLLFADGRCPSRVQIDKLAAEQQAQGIYKVTALVRNAGYLPTFVSQRGQNPRVDDPLTAKLETAGPLRRGRRENRSSGRIQR